MSELQQLGLYLSAGAMLIGVLWGLGHEIGRVFEMRSGR